MSIRALLTRLHRIVGLATAGFLFVAGITGSLIAFWPELDVALNPDLFRAASTGERLPPSALAAAVEAADPRAQVTGVPLRLAPGEAAVVLVKPRDPGAPPAALGYDQVFVDPVTGTVFGWRLWGACCFERQHLMPFIHTLHYTLYLPGRWGVWIMGTAAILWFFDCFIAIVLTFPRRRPFLLRWSSSLRISRGAGPGRMTFDIHRAGGLWLWLALVPLAMSGVALNLYEEVFRSVVSAVLPVTPHPTRVAPPGERIGFDAAVVRGRAEAARLGWPEPGTVYFDAATGTYIVSFQRSQIDRGEGMGLSALIFDAISGDLLDEHVHGTSRIGDTVLEIQFTLHSGRVAGVAGRVLIGLAGLVVAALSLTGVLMWSRRRRAQARLRTA